ncbi:hypothetical protein [Paraflavitalea speifideaquila]|uniref:hypothetical protein n=1 Tax=Paraflavitalea speifideaquila TaxID=3076558 RepID=UPI0028ED3029|nr:hypothetical protein [Paraflavitalea speifideiaquila]
MKLPYSAAGRICWLVCIMGGLVALFYASAVYIVTGQFTLNEPSMALLTGTTIAALILTLYFNRRAFDQEQDSISISKPT